MFKGIDRLVEMQIQSAEKRGALENLPGEGKPHDVDDLAGLSHDERIEALLARSTGAVPEEVILLREIADLREALERSADAAEQEQLRAALREKSVRLSILFERSGKYILANEALKFVP